MLPLDLRDEAGLRALVRQPFDLILHAAGLVDIAACERDPALAWALNVRPAQMIVEHTSARLVYFSSDNVFDGTQAAYTERDRPAPVNVYGHTKHQAELQVLSRPGNLVIRLPFLFGWSPWADTFLSRLARPVTRAPVDTWCNPVYLPDLAAHLPDLWRLDGIVHYGGPTVVSRYEFFDLTQRCLDLPTRVEAVSSAEAFGAFRRPPHPILKSERLDIQGRDLLEALADLRAWLASLSPVAPPGDAGPAQE